MYSLADAAASIEQVSPAIVSQAWDIVNREGGFENNPGDAGGATNDGVSLLYARSVTYVDENGNTQLTFDMNHDGAVDVTDIEEITPQIAVGVFIIDFFQRVGLIYLPDFMQAETFDTSVNGGQNKAVRLLQMTVNTLRNTIPAVAAAVPFALTIDGAFGAKTNIAVQYAADNCTIAEMVNTFADRRVADYRAIAAAHPNDEQFLNGWLTRANSFRV